MPKKSYRQAINEAIRQEMERDASVILLGEDVAGGAGTTGERDAYGGVMGVTKGLIGRFGEGRVIDTPITESAIIGAANGAALCGMRPIAEIMFIDFVGVCFDQIYNQAAKFRYMFGGKAKTPMVVRGMAGAGARCAAQHSQMLSNLFTMVPGLKVCLPSNPYDAKGLLIQAIRDDDPVIFLEHKTLYDIEGEVPDEPYAIPFGEAEIPREGDDVTVVAFSSMVNRANIVADSLDKEGISVEVIDPRTSSPFDLETVLESVENTGRLVIVDENPPRCSLAADVAAQVAQHGFHFLKAPVEMVTPPHTPVPFSPELEDMYVPTANRIESAVRKAVGAQKAAA